MKQYLLVLLLLLYSCFVYSQSNESVENLLKKGEESYLKGDYQEATQQFKKGVALIKKSGNNQLLSKAYNNIGSALSQLGKSEEALSNFLLSIDISIEQNDSLSIANTYKDIGALYEEQKDFVNAMKYYNRSYALANILNNLSLKADCQNNMGIIYEQQKNYKKALELYSSALKIYTTKGDEQKISMVYNNLAIAHKYLKNYIEAIKNYEAALFLSTKLGDKFMVAANQNNLGNVYALTGNYLKSLKLCQLANTNAKAINALEIIIESYDGISTAYEKLNQYSNAIKFRKLYEQEKDNYINITRSSQLAEIQTKYETQKKVDSIKLLHKEGAIKKLQIKEQSFKIERLSYLLSLFSLWLIAVIVFWYFWNSKQKQIAKLTADKLIKKTEEQERLRMAKDIHDDLGSGLTKINFLSEIICQKTENFPEIKEKSEAVKETAKKMIGNMRDLIWALNPDNATMVNILARMREYSTDYLEDYPIEIQYSIPEKIPQLAINKESHRELFMVVKETLNNIAKHSKATKIFFNVKISLDTFELSIIDNGIGFTTDAYKKGNGLQNMQHRLESIGGHCEIISKATQGTEINVKIPIQKIIKK